MNALEDSSFSDNYAFANGGAVYFETDVESVQISGCEFAFNSAIDESGVEESSGGVLYFLQPISNVRIEDSVFDWNSAESNGGRKQSVYCYVFVFTCCSDLCDS